MSIIIPGSVQSILDTIPVSGNLKVDFDAAVTALRRAAERSRELGYEAKADEQDAYATWMVAEDRKLLRKAIVSPIRTATCSQCGAGIYSAEMFRGPVCPRCGHWC